MSHQPKVKTKTCEQYLNAKKRVANKQRKLDKMIARLEKYRETHPLKENPNTKRLPERKSTANIVKSCRIGREAEGFKKEDFKQNPKKVKKI